MTAQQQPTPKPSPQLSPRQDRFVGEYLIDLNATKAVVRAGYSERTAGIYASRLLRTPSVAAAIAERKAARSEKTGVEAARVIEEMAAVAFSDIGDIIDFSGPTPRLRKPEDVPERARRALSSVKVKRQREGSGEDAVDVEIIEFKLWDKNAALAQLAKHTGAVKEKVEVESSSVAVVEKIVDRHMPIEEFKKLSPQERINHLKEMLKTSPRLPDLGQANRAGK